MLQSIAYSNHPIQKYWNNENYYGYIYLIYDQKNNKIYIGQKKGKIEETSNYFGSSKILRDKIKFRKLLLLKKIILGVCNSKEKLDEAEILCIEFFQSNNFLYGYNLTNGGAGGDTFSFHTDDEKYEIGRKLSLIHRHSVYTEEYKQEIANNNNYGMKNKKHTQKTCNQISNYMLSKKMKWMHKEFEEKQIPEEIINICLQQGWKIGKISKGDKMLNLNKKMIILDMANNHNGDINKGKEIIKQFHEIVKPFLSIFQFCIKFQYRDLPDFVHLDYRNNFSYKYVKRFTETFLTFEQYEILTRYAKSLNFLTSATPFSENAAIKLKEHNHNFIKVASCSVTDWPLLEKIAQIDLPLILSTAGVSEQELDKVYTFLNHRDKKFCFLVCKAEYPTLEENLELNQINFLIERYKNIQIGISVHEEPDKYEAIKLIIAKNVKIIECHIDLDCETKNNYSKTPIQLNKWLINAREALEMCGVEYQRYKVSEKELVSLRSLRRGAFAKQDLKEGQKITKGDLYFAIPLLENHLSANNMSKYIDYTLVKEIKKDEPILISDVNIFNREVKIREIYEKVKSFLVESKVPIPEKFEMELSHHYGLDRFYEIGTAIVTLFNREYAKKLLVILPKQKHPEHRHILKEETFDVLFGELYLIINDNIDSECILLKTGEHYTVERKVYHSFSSNVGCILEEVSTTQYPNDSEYSDLLIMNNYNDRKTKIMFSK